MMELPWEWDASNGGLPECALKRQLKDKALDKAHGCEGEIKLGGWRVESGGWRMEDGGWRMEDGGWSMEGGGGCNRW